MQDLSLLRAILLYAVPVLYAIAIHEAAHGYAARYFGDRTAEAQGRLTLNPLAHIDPVGTILVPAVLLIMAKLSGAPPILFGWAKPVPVVWRNLKNPRRDMALVAAAGPASNLVMASVWALILAFAGSVGGASLAFGALVDMAWFGIVINVVLAVFNLLPIPPLDGGRVLVGILPPRTAMSFARIEPFGFMIILALLVTGLLWTVLGPIVALVAQLFFSLAGY